MPTLNDALKVELEKIFKALQKAGMMPSEIPVSQMEKIIDNVAENIASVSDLKTLDLRNPSLQMALKLSLISEFVGIKYPDMTFNYKMLFQNNFDANKPQLEKELKQELSKLLTTLNKLNPKLQYSNDFVDELSKKLAQNITNNFFAQTEQKALAENEVAVGVFAEMFTPLQQTAEEKALEASYRSYFGGIDPRYPGGVMMAVTTVLGNLAGLVDPVANQGSGTFLDQLNEFSEKGDPNGTKNSIRTRLKAIGSELEIDLTAEGYVNHIKPKDPTSTKPY